MFVLLPRQFCILIAVSCVVSPAAGAQIECRLSAEKVPAYGRVEIRFADIFGVDNPDDPRQADVQGVFISPSGRQWRMPGFLYQDFRRDGGDIVLHGKPEWCVRFAPIEPGQWKARIQASVGGKTLTAEAGVFEVTPAKARGFLRRSKANPLALEFENGDPLIAIGSNLFPRTATYIRAKRDTPLGCRRAQETVDYLEATAAAGGTFCRLRMDAWFIPIEMTANKAMGYRGAGRYHPQACWEIDRIVEAAERLGVTLMPCIYSANFNVNVPLIKERVRYNFFHVDNGGPLADMRDFWTDPECRRLVRQKIRYCVARWGASPAIGVWEFFNEVRLRGPEVVAWHRDLAGQWHALDPYGRPVSTSPSVSSNLTENFWELFQSPEIDVVQYHTYDFDDMAQGIGATNLRIVERIGKPLLIGEFGPKPRTLKTMALGKFDPTGLHLHNGIWAAGLTGATGALPWYLQRCIDPFDLYHVYTGFSRFAADWKINAGPWRPVAARVVADTKSLGDARWGPLVLPSRQRMERRKTDVYTVGRDGSLLEADRVNSNLFGLAAHKDLRRPPTFAVDYPVDGRFVVTVNWAVGKPDSRIPVLIHLDGQEAARKVISIERGHGENALPLNRWGNVEIYCKEEVAIDVPAGPHRIRVENTGPSRVAVDYRLEPYADRSLVTYRVYAMGLGNEVRLWIQNAQHTHVNQYYKKLPTTAPSAEICVPVENDGRYEVQWWDTYKGKPTRHETVEANEGILTLSFPGTTSDEACKIRRILP